MKTKIPTHKFIWNYKYIWMSRVVGFNSIWCLCSSYIKAYLTIFQKDIPMYRFNCFVLLYTLQVPNFIIGSSLKRLLCTAASLVKSSQSYVIKSPLWTILWFRILGIFSVENIKRLCGFMFQTWDNSQLLRRVLWISAELTIVSSWKHKNTQPLYIFNRVRVLHLDRLKEGTWLHSFESSCSFFSW